MYTDHLGQATPSIVVDPTKPKPWYVSITEQFLEAKKVLDVQKINRERLAQGLPPLSDAEMRALTGAVRAQVELPQDVKNMIMIGGVAALAILFLSLNKRRR